MKKVLTVEGMTCKHCSARLEKALNALDGVTAVVDLEAKTATVTLDREIEDAKLIAAVEEAGYDVTEVK